MKEQWRAELKYTVGTAESRMLAARMAALLARFALADPKYREKALWAEASAQTLERTLGLFSADERDHEFTGKPWRMERDA